MPDLPNMDDVLRRGVSVSGGGGLGTGGPPAAAASGGGAPPASGSPYQVQSIHAGGATLVNPAVDAPPNFQADQESAHQLEDLRAQLNNLKNSVDAAKARQDNTSTFDKTIIGLATKVPGVNEMLAGQPQQIPEQMRNRAEHGAMHHFGMLTERQNVFADADQMTQAIYALLHAQTKLRAFQAIQKVEDHLPHATDSNELLEEKHKFWVERFNRGAAELKERGFKVNDLSGTGYQPPDRSTPPGSAPPITPSAPGAGGEWKGFASPPPVAVLRKEGKSPADMRIMGPDKKWYYYDKDDGTWVKFGGP
jgi:hypothetical protein